MSKIDISFMNLSMAPFQVGVIMAWIKSSQNHQCDPEEIVSRVWLQHVECACALLHTSSSSLFIIISSPRASTTIIITNVWIEMMNDSVSAPADVPSTMVEPVNTTSVGKGQATVNSQTSVLRSAAYAPTTMMEPSNAKKGIKNLLDEKKGPTHHKKARTVYGKKELSRETYF